LTFRCLLTMIFLRQAAVTGSRFSGRVLDRGCSIYVLPDGCGPAHFLYSSFSLLAV